MAPTQKILGRRPITLEDALGEEFNMLERLVHAPAVEKLYQELSDQTPVIEALTRHHLGLGSGDTCNVCARAASPSKVVFHCPMPNKVAEQKHPGTVDEKLGCEVGAYIWVEEQCPEIRTPHRYGFGFTDRHLPFLTRVVRRFWRSIHQLLGRPLLSNYIPHPPRQKAALGAYMILEYFGPDTGVMLSNTFPTQRSDPARRQRLFKGIAQIMLSLARVPQPRIGAFRFHDDGTITLTNRPLTCSMMILENDGAARTMQPGDTYGCTDAFVSETLTFHDRRFLSQPNAVFDERDCRAQMAVKAVLRILSHVYVRRDLREGPFPLQLTDFHASNIFVDEEWNVTGLVDLKWLCALPAEQLDVPYWLTGCSIDHIEGEKLEEFDVTRREFMGVFDAVERAAAGKGRAPRGLELSRIMREVWESKGTWFWHSLSSANAMYLLLETHFVWSVDSDEVVQKKVADKKAYDEDLKRVFAGTGP
ncbi:hypothetical protein C8A05DRAFT_45750 [Staphylotrichum tortipilum]|uniref:Aminoglycoside phosphotransferase domain-containing protein n=1 Tax=Staphylotrichum tortipilum TaxID=2831512 RepID=A0AAN6MH10_9PEZI|nr:hypothetical protein C8A05DRAFT_45750 [Staphylotrichum longicolle]